MKNCIYHYAQKVNDMRKAQKEYFILALAIRNNPGLHPQRKKALAKSKELENEVDKITEELIKTEHQITMAQLTDDEQAEYGQDLI